jgi:hypothetical protein
VTLSADTAFTLTCSNSAGSDIAQLVISIESVVLNGYLSVSAGELHTCGIKSDNSVACWGYNDYGQSTPPSGSFLSVSAGTSYTCGLRDSGVVICWGILAR